MASMLIFSYTCIDRDMYGAALGLSSQQPPSRTSSRAFQPRNNRFVEPVHVRACSSSQVPTIFFNMLAEYVRACMRTSMYSTSGLFSLDRRVTFEYSSTGNKLSKWKFIHMGNSLKLCYFGIISHVYPITQNIVLSTWN